jgi:hypothetical protein
VFQFISYFPVHQCDRSPNFTANTDFHITKFSTKFSHCEIIVKKLKYIIKVERRGKRPWGHPGGTGTRAGLDLSTFSKTNILPYY